VQLLMEGEHVTEVDRRLMRIVVREAERLSDLLTDFLLYARPVPPERTAVDVSVLLDELADIAAADPRFTRVDIRREYRAGVVMSLDRRQIHQALWNLAINGAEAMAEGGTMWIGAGTGEISVEDSGPGVSPELRERIFNPFFTTKDRGTGLGLATVHTIVTAHGGSVELGEGRSGGARFVLHLSPPQPPAESQAL
jgi:two-component system sensor histidine kinase PilS (NtrC family)